MRQSLVKKIVRLLTEESMEELDDPLLTKLRELASEDVVYLNWEPSQRKALSKFFDDVRDVCLKELLIGEYGAKIILDSIIVLCFETGYKLAKRG